MKNLKRSDVEKIVDPETGAKTFRLGDLESVVRCTICGAPYVPKNGHSINPQITCGTKECKEERHQRMRVARSGGEWAFAAPSCEPHLPGAGLELHLSPMRQAVEHRHMRYVHGFITSIIDSGHSGWPDWALVPWPVGCGWGLYVRSDEHVERLAGHTFEGRLFDRPVEARFSARVRIRTPSITRGRRRVRVDAITPVVIQSDGRTVSRPMPTASSLFSALTKDLPARLGVDAPHESVKLEVVSHETTAASVQLAGKFGAVRGWVGSCVVEGNAVARWLLHAAGRGPGLGGRCAFGFGRVRVTDL